MVYMYVYIPISFKQNSSNSEKSMTFAYRDVTFCMAFMYYGGRLGVGTVSNGGRGGFQRVWRHFKKPTSQGFFRMVVYVHPPKLTNGYPKIWKNGCQSDAGATNHQGWNVWKNCTGHPSAHGPGTMDRCALQKHHQFLLTQLLLTDVFGGTRRQSQTAAVALHGISSCIAIIWVRFVWHGKGSTSHIPVATCCVSKENLSSNTERQVVDKP